ncbi:MAG: diguanylate cyclase [Eubacteriales bacterium]
MKSMRKYIAFLNYEIHTLEYQNHMIAALTAFICMICSIMNFAYFKLLGIMHIADILKNSTIFFLIGITYILCTKIIRNQNKVRLMLNLLTVFLIVCFVVIYYPLIGPTVWTGTFIVIIITLLSENRIIFILLSITLASLGIYEWSTRIHFVMDDNYYISQFIGFTVLFLVASFVFENNKRRNLTIGTQLNKMKIMTQDLETWNKRLTEEIVEHQKAITLLDQSEKRFKSIIRTLPDAIFKLNFQGYFIDCESRDTSWLLRPKEEFIGKTIGDILPEKISALCMEKVVTAQLTNEMQTLEYKLVNSGKEAFYEVRFVKSNADELLAILRDITEQKQQQVEIRQLSRMKDVVLAINHRLAEDVSLDEFFKYILSRVREVMPHAELGCILMLDEEGYLSMAASFGYLQEANYNFRLPLKESFAYRMTAGDYSHTVIINNIQTLLNPSFVEVMDNKDGVLVQSSISGPIYKDNKLYGLINIDSKENNVYTENDISIMEYLREQLGLALSHREIFRQYAFLSKHDQLTGFHNRWYLEELESDRAPRWRRYASDILMAVIDLNELKKLNDELGHHEGDNYIKTYSESMKRVFRSTDLFIRLGGDEFAGIFFNISEQELISKLDEVNQNIADCEIQKRAHNTKLGFAYGIVRFGDPSFNIQEIIQMADAKMYCQKVAIKERQSIKSDMPAPLN